MKFRSAVVGAFLGGALVGALCLFVRWFGRHHYEEIDTFFTGTIAGKKVRGVSYFDYHGFVFLESNQWKILLEDDHGQSVIIYQNRPTFQEPLPHEPHVEIKGSEIIIDDGLNSLKIQVDP